MCFKNKKFSLFLLILFLSIFLNSCVGQKKIMESWIGLSSDQLIETWGAPDTVIGLDNGNRVLTWITLWNTNYSVNTCRRSFTIDSNSIVIKWSYSDCGLF